MYENIMDFKARALEEVKRAKRYLSFVSLVSFDISHIKEDNDIENFDSIRTFHDAVRGLISDSARETDLISTVYDGKIYVLLVETPKEGAEIFSKRLKEIIKYFIYNNAKSPFNWRVGSREAYFPGSKNKTDSFIDALQDLNN